MVSNTADAKHGSRRHNSVGNRRATHEKSCLSYSMATCAQWQTIHTGTRIGSCSNKIVNQPISNVFEMEAETTDNVGADKAHNTPGNNHGRSNRNRVNQTNSNTCNMIKTSDKQIGPMKTRPPPLAMDAVGTIVWTRPSPLLRTRPSYAYVRTYARA